MYPIIMDDTKPLSVLFQDNSNGLGRLTDATAVKVTEEINGQFTAEITYPVTGAHFSDIHDSGILKIRVAPGKPAQLFRISSIKKKSKTTATISLNHISYDLSKVAVKPFTAQGIADTLQKLKENFVGTHPFIFDTDLTNTSSKFGAITKPGSARSYLAGQEGSVLDVFGGEYEFDNETITLKSRLGADRGVTFRYGKNITESTETRDASAVYDAIICYATTGTGDDAETVISDPQYVGGEAIESPRCLVVDVSSEYNQSGTGTTGEETEETVTKEELNARAQKYIQDNAPGKMRRSFTLSFVQLSDMDSYNAAPVQEVQLGDTVHVILDDGEKYETRINSYTYDALCEKYISVSLGDISASISETIKQTANGDIKPLTESEVKAIVKHQTDLITGRKQGYMVTDYADNKETVPSGLLFMDSPDKAQAKNVMRLNMNGIGFSKDGYAGEYTQAWTLDGIFNSDFINGKTIKTVTIEGAVFKGEECTFGTEGRGALVVRPDIQSGSVWGTQFETEGTVEWAVQNPFTISAKGVFFKDIDANGETAAYLNVGQWGEITLTAKGNIYIDSEETVSIGGLKVKSDSISATNVAVQLINQGNSFRLGNRAEFTLKTGNSNIIGAPVIIYSGGGAVGAMLDAGTLRTYDGNGNVTATYNLNSLKV